jgi:hypothetical protein
MNMFSFSSKSLHEKMPARPQARDELHDTCRHWGRHNQNIRRLRLGCIDADFAFFKSSLQISHLDLQNARYLVIHVSDLNLSVRHSRPKLRTCLSVCSKEAFLS